MPSWQLSTWRKDTLYTSLPVAKPFSSCWYLFSLMPPAWLELYNSIKMFLWSSSVLKTNSDHILFEFSQGPRGHFLWILAWSDKSKAWLSFLPVSQDAGRLHKLSLIPPPSTNAHFSVSNWLFMSVLYLLLGFPVMGKKGIRQMCHIVDKLDIYFHMMYFIFKMYLLLHHREQLDTIKNTTLRDKDPHHGAMSE